MDIRSSDYKELVRLAKEDTEAFRYKEMVLIMRFIDSTPAEYRESLYALQNKIEDMKVELGCNRWP